MLLNNAKRFFFFFNLNFLRAFFHHLLFFFQPHSDLYGLIQIMIVVFGEEPPVFSRPATQAPYQAFQAAGPPNREW